MISCLCRRAAAQTYPDNFIPGDSIVSTVELRAIISVGAGIFILVKPKLLNYIVAIYLIAAGVLVLVEG